MNLAHTGGVHQSWMPDMPGD